MNLLETGQTAASHHASPAGNGKGQMPYMLYLGRAEMIDRAAAAREAGSQAQAWAIGCFWTADLQVGIVTAGKADLEVGGPGRVTPSRP